MCVPPGHFTQVVWKDSTQLGVGMATKGNKVYVVGQYRPAGNMNRTEYFQKNVGPLGSLSVDPNQHSSFFHVLRWYSLFFLQTPVGSEAAELNLVVYSVSCFFVIMFICHYG